MSTSLMQSVFVCAQEFISDRSELVDFCCKYAIRDAFTTWQIFTCLTTAICGRLESSCLQLLQGVLRWKQTEF